MLRPEPMSRVMLVGPKDQLEQVIETLHGLKILHLIDYKGEDKSFSAGKPSARAASISEDLVKLRAISNIIQVASVKKPGESMIGGDLHQNIKTLEINILEEEGSKKKAESLISALDAQIAEMEPFARLGLDLGHYGGYATIEAMAGKVTGDVDDLAAVAPEHELFRAGDVVAVFVPKEKADATREYLLRKGFSSTSVPKAGGDPRAALAESMRQREKWGARLKDINERLVKMRQRYARFIIEAEKQLGVEIEKAEAPLRFATSEHSFVIDGWLPTSAFAKLEPQLAESGSIYVERLESDDKDAPTLLKNARVVKPFETFIQVYSTPSYKEHDPTVVLTLIFPVFFGFMIGDVGYGAVWLALGGLAVWKAPKGGFRDLMVALTMGGFFALLFGLFLFGEAFGMPFIAPHATPENPNPMGWDTSVGLYIPIGSVLHKLENPVELMLIAVLAGFVHLTIGYLFGVANEWRHNRKHSVAKIAWLIVLTGLFMVVLARAARWPGFGRDLSAALFGWVPGGGIVYESIGFMSVNPIPYAAIVMLVAGAVILLVTEGALAPIEIISLFANMMSYLRLAGVAMAKAASASAFNVMVLMAAAGGGVNIALALLLGFVFHTIIFMLGAVTASIQAIRLNYVECFLKFFKGNGTRFHPFGTAKTQEV